MAKQTTLSPPFQLHVKQEARTNLRACTYMLLKLEEILQYSIRLEKSPTTEERELSQIHVCPLIGASLIATVYICVCVSIK